MVNKKFVALFLQFYIIRLLGKITMIYYLHVIVSGTLNDEALHVLLGGAVGQLQQTTDLQGLVHLGHLIIKKCQVS